MAPLESIAMFCSRPTFGMDGADLGHPTEYDGRHRRQLNNAIAADTWHTYRIALPEFLSRPTAFRSPLCA